MFWTGNDTYAVFLLNCILIGNNYYFLAYEVFKCDVKKLPLLYEDRCSLICSSDLEDQFSHLIRVSHLLAFLIGRIGTWKSMERFAFQEIFKAKKLKKMKNLLVQIRSRYIRILLNVLENTSLSVIGFITWRPKFLPYFFL